jgi:hypothetical protein
MFVKDAKSPNLLVSASHLDICLVFTHLDVSEEDEDGLLFSLRQCDRVRRVSAFRWLFRISLKPSERRRIYDTSS